MNWREIKEKCPKAIDELYDYFNIPFDGYSSRFGHLQIRLNSKHDHVSIRNLYDFFDENEIQCEVEYFAKDEIYRKEDEVFWKGGVWDQDDFFWRHDEEFKTRTEAEQAAFEKAFEILENKLK